MLNSKSFLAADFGAGSLKMAEFEQNDAGGLRLKQYGIKSLGLEGSKEDAREAAITKAMQELLAERNFASRQSNVCAPGFHVFSKFVKLPPVDAGKVTQIIRYEAQQNVPFPLDEVVWDYQILGTTPTNELEVLLVAVKSEVIEGLFRVGEAGGLKIKLVDVSAAALCNAFRYNYGDVDGCSMLLDIGAKTSNVLFFEKGKVYTRSINIGANSITQDFGTEAKMKFPEAEAIKLEKGSVSLGGAYEEPEDPQAAAIAKMARQVMTRLHIQVNQTVQFYKSQQGGSAPERLYLCGGASIMPYMAQFFAEKLNLPVDYFNPFRNIEIDPSLDLEDLSKFAHSFRGEVVGLGLRDLAHCPVELNLMPKSSIQRQEFSQKKPYFIAAIFSLALAVFLLDRGEAKLSDGWKTKLDNDVTHQLETLKGSRQKLNEAVNARDDDYKKAKSFLTVGQNHVYWMRDLAELRRLLIETETEENQVLTATNGGTNVDTGLWVEKFDPVLPGGNAFAGTPVQEEVIDSFFGARSSAPARVYNPATDPRAQMMQNAGRLPMGAAPQPGRTMITAATAATTATADISQIKLVLRTIDRSRIAASANADAAYTFQKLAKKSSCFTNVDLDDQGFQPDQTGDTNTMTLGATIFLKEPLHL